MQADEREIARRMARVAITGGGEAPLALALGGGLLLREIDFRRLTLHAIEKRLSIGEVALVEEPALSGARAALHFGTP